ncbi:uncharacterized protein LOC111709616 [Eurytemora carolleeae]|uniref:uncharacterized protein LOC111709616 n=1 Tax=Eurytemora carolleeae TaxID=1294199 RepID=UPI000C793B2B|nr:uncharacterized protein LOC111709616 [Eurytemora carolleeae]|eukprot:XP_023339124.1 uncharacterized protein LOC111709616 [Eurytemora affinis]
MFKFCIFCVVSLTSLTSSERSYRCQVDTEVKFILNNMTPLAVRKEVDCVVGVGSCDALGRRIKARAADVVQRPRCAKPCSCEEINVRLVVNKMKRNHMDQWRRVENHFR